MVAYSVVRDSNMLIANSLPEGLVAVFVGGTSGIGEYTLKELARAARKPRIYILGRSQTSFDRIAADCKQINPEGRYSFVQGDISLLRNVDRLCHKVQEQESAINIVFWSAGTLISKQKTAEGLDVAAALRVYSRTRIIANFLPQLAAATGIRRVVSVSTGTDEGAVDFDDFQLLRGGGLAKQRAHNSSIISLTNMYFAHKAPTVSFIHDYPGLVRSGISRGTTGALRAAFVVMNALGPLLFYKPDQESGARHLYYLTSARFKAKEGVEESVPVGDGIAVARGVDGVSGGGIYSCDADNEEAPRKVERILARHKEQGAVERVWKQIQDDTDAILRPVHQEA
ncbi:NAD(P)-binding domain protein [Cordyceps fumosorosea ARSEF 2679]|uniref:NAD(P)-binding domain protein n=1 Tax=Cordyceps fumosorosea (strain ARSEF 2679) TaxID=1081104 RepID=A0A167LKQ7_CORFA|nr:NAD(P)-binding domain protein [Cordyceps fumosorosea ARSEF 2679]OAA53197.1 NAD(P)-binding domain protein [Cordyceps fumosorosea ARSEF 2679]